MLKKFALPIAFGYTLVLTFLSFIRLDDFPKSGSGFDDKVYHVIAYIVLMYFWVLALKIERSKTKLLLLAASCIVFGIIIEALQSKFTTHRINDSIDIIANSLGVFIALIYVFVRSKDLS